MKHRVIIFHSTDVDSLRFPKLPWDYERLLNELVKSARDRKAGTYKLVAVLDNMDDCEHAWTTSQNREGERPWIKQIPGLWVGPDFKDSESARSSAVGDVFLIQAEPIAAPALWSLYASAPIGMEFMGILVGVITLT